MIDNKKLKKSLEQNIIEQLSYIYDLAEDTIISPNNDYDLYDFTDVTKCDKMSTYVSNPENYNFELGKYIVFKEILEKLQE